ncbi:M48 family metallopeptidase [Rhodocista pekingensis]|uniref:M48 family metallopeptidase n=1 Tax=Rhodocista pekingensis TaxID=201185 RepID=A0ABW2KVI7_9PROT
MTRPAAGGSAPPSGAAPGDLGSARYQDGATGRTLPVRLRAEAAWLVILHPDGRELDRWPGDGVRPLPDGPPGALGLEAGSAVRLLPDDDATPARLAAAFPAIAGPAHRPPRRWAAGPTLAGAVLSLLLVVFVLIPALAPVLTELVPPSLDRRVGEAVAESLADMIGADMVGDEGLPRRCEDPAGTAALETMLARLSGPGPHVPADGFSVRVVGSRMVNAFALPGGILVVPAAMITVADSPEALAGVLAHEMGHAVARDPMVRVIRVGLFGAVLSLVTGDFSGGVVAALLTQALESGYSQEREMAADAFAADRLEAAGLPVGPLARLFERMRDIHGDPPVWLRWLSSHPDTAVRIAALEARLSRDPPAGAVPLLLPEAWDALRRICGSVVAPEPAPPEPVGGASGGGVSRGGPA